MNKKISVISCIYCSESPNPIRSSIFFTQSDTSSRLKNLTQSLTEVLQKFAHSHQKLKSILDQKLKNLESESTADSHDNFDETSFDNLQMGSTFLLLENANELVQDAIKRIDISGASLSHEKGNYLDADLVLQGTSSYSNLRHTVSRCLILSTQLKHQLEQISRNTLDKAYFADSESAEPVKTGNQKKPCNFYIGGILSRPKKPLIVFSRNRSARRQLEF